LAWLTLVTFTDFISQMYEPESLERRILFLELLCAKQRAELKYCFGLLFELLQKTDSRYEPRELEQVFEAQIDKEVEQWIAEEANDDVSKASLLSALHQQLKQKSQQGDSASGQT
jgi:hypothetical protein